MSFLDRKVLLIGEPMGLFIAEKEGPLEEVESFAAAVCGGSWLCTDNLLKEENYEEIERLCREAVALSESVPDMALL